MRHEFPLLGVQELRQKVEAERQANMEAVMKLNELEQLLKTERKSFKHQLADAKKVVRDSVKPCPMKNHQVHVI